MTAHPKNEAGLWPRWAGAARTPAVDAALRELYQRLDAAVAARGPTCWVSGRCCNFDAFGHRLYVTGLEIAWVTAQVEPTRTQGQDPTGSCVLQVKGMCSVHTIRPLGCRVFFCQEGTQQWQQELYEQFLGELRTLHQRFDLPYRYTEWRAGLIDCAASGSP